MPVALNANAFLTLEQAKRWLGIPSTETGPEDLVSELINEASDAIERITSRKLKALELTEYREGRDTNRLLFREYPVNSVASVRIDASSVFTDPSTLLAATEYNVQNGMELVLSRRIPRGDRNVKLVYNAGYTTIPPVLERACKLIIEHAYQMRTDRRIGQSSKSKAGESVSFTDGIPKAAQELIDPFIRYEFPNLEGPVQNT